MIDFEIADEGHTGVVAEMLAALFQEVGHTLTAAEIADIFSDIDADDRHSALLAFIEDEQSERHYVGIITLAETLSLYAGGRLGVINELYVVPAFRSEGVGKMLLNEAKHLANHRGWVRLEVTTPGEEYAKTLRFYEREGFMAIGPRYKWQA